MLRWALLVGASGLLVAFLAFVDVEVSGNWQGVFLLRARDPARLLVKDDLFLGDGSRLIAGVPFSPLRRLASPPSGGARLDSKWSEAAGNGWVRNHLGDGTELVTMFSRFEDDDGATPHGLFVGGALPAAAATALPEESGMSFRDARGWHHVWCTTNEAIVDTPTWTLIYPSRWRYLGGRALIRDPGRVVLESSHAVEVTGGTLRVDRYAYFRAGNPYFKLGVRFSNAGDEPVRIIYAYGDEPWVGHYGSSAGNVGWIRDELVRVEGPVDPGDARWAGIVDEESGIAAFLAWSEESRPRRTYFANQPGSKFKRLGQPLTSNTIFVGTEWLIELRPGEARSVLLTVGMARGARPGGVPVLPPNAVP